VFGFGRSNPAQIMMVKKTIENLSAVGNCMSIADRRRIITRMVDE
jgi:hypothetical protein